MVYCIYIYIARDLCLNLASLNHNVIKDALLPLMILRPTAHYNYNFRFITETLKDCLLDSQEKPFFHLELYPKIKPKRILQKRRKVSSEFVIGKH